MSEPSNYNRHAERPALLSLPPDPLRPSPRPSDEQTNLRKTQYPDESRVPRHRFLSTTEWTIFARGVGGIRDTEHNAPVHPVSWWWPSKGLPPGLYRDVIFRRSKSFYLFHIASVVRWGLMIAQLLLGASLTALGALRLQDGTTITVLGATNTIIAGLLALLHNSGLPDRYRHDMSEFEHVEDHIAEVLTTRLVRADKTVGQVLAECYDRYHDAKTTVEANMPVTYTPSHNLQAGRSVPMVAPRAVTPPKGSRANSEDDKGPAAKEGK
ncbi:c6 transcription factor [Fusarium albosuccineum]|uniref:C6 transcription factor n=1 Tax=Fusarium albosuccineum TaxID=1237068 RepID=A0A8H4LEG1_9HYPO|nr:c6 transcription factor [Fusarium albosuccineum]